MIKEIEKVLIENVPGFYRAWLNMQKEHQNRIQKELRDIIRREVLGKAFTQALAQDLLEEEIKLDSHLMRYLRSRVYHGNLKALLTDLQSIREDESQQRRKQRFKQNA